MIACLACFLAMANNGPAAAADEINSTLTLLQAMGWEYDRAFTGITDITEFQEPKDIGMGQEIKRRCDVDPPTRLCEEWDPREIKKTEAEAMSGKSSADLAVILTAAADASMFAGILLEFGIAREIGRGPTSIGLDTGNLGLNNPAQDGPRAERCFAATVSNNTRSGRVYVFEETPELTEAGQVRKVEAYISPIALMTEASCMLLVASETLTTVQGRAPIETSWASAFVSAADRILFHGVEQVGTDFAYLLSIDNPGLTQTTDSGHQLTIDKLESWIHVDYLTEVKNRASGMLTYRGETRALFIEEERGEFRWLPGTQMHHPFRTTNRVGGIFSEEELEEISEMAGSLDELEQQMAAMSPQQRQQMQQMMGPRINQLRTMVDSGVFEFTLITKRVLINTDAREALSGNVAYKPELLTQEIQSNLKLLGYDPGEIDGQLSRETIVAIVRFERDYQLALTGRPTPELARIISATLSAIR